MISPNTPFSEIDDNLLLCEFNEPKKYKRINLYALMARRANSNEKIKLKLFDQILNEEARREIIAGRIMHSWFPAIYILKESNDYIKLELKLVLRNWRKKEKEDFLDYVKSEQEYYCLLYDIL